MLLNERLAPVDVATVFDVLHELSSRIGTRLEHLAETKREADRLEFPYPHKSQIGIGCIDGWGGLFDGKLGTQNSKHKSTS